MIYKKEKISIIIPFLILVFSTLIIRLIALNNTLMMNNDGTVYIHQARAIYHGLWQTVNSCTIDYLTIYTILIAAVYPMIGDWMNAAMAVNLVFGTLMIIPLYLFLRRFLDDKTSFFTTFIFAMLPMFVIQSVNVFRDPSFWFFSILGLYFLVFDHESKNPYALILSSISFIVATATRIEGIAFIIGGLLYVLMAFKQHRFKSIILFLSPVILIVSCFVFFQFIRNTGDFYWYRFHEIPLIVKKLYGHYLKLEKGITSLMTNLPHGSIKGFLEYSRTLIWFTAIGVILNSALEAYYYIFFLLLLFGFKGLKSRMQKDSRILPLLVTTAIILFILYLYCLNTWSMENRRMATVILPSAFIVGFGAENLLRWLHQRFGISNVKSVALLCILVLVITLPKNLRIQEADKLVFKEIGETIAKFDGNSSEIELITLGDAGRWIEYYANLHVAGAPCPDKYRNWYNKKIIGSKYGDLINNIKNREISYVVWEEKYWLQKKYDFLKSAQANDLKKIKEWNHPDAGRIILYQVLYENKKSRV
jgi:4-amino-4-deoxy-L-arabinose transferase-like glycosyltransferase